MDLYQKEIEGLYPKQIEFCKSEARETLYGGAVGGGKSYVMRLKLVLLALNYEGIQILLLRKTMPEVLTNHKIPLKQLTEPYGLAKFVGGSINELRFKNGSVIYLGYCSSDDDVEKYQGNQYEVIAIDEAGNFTFEWYKGLKARNRLSGLIKYKEGQEKIRPRMYFSANPVGVGLMWLKRLFVDKEYSEEELLPYKKKIVQEKIEKGEIRMKMPAKYSGDFSEFFTKKELDELNKKANALCSEQYKFIPASVYDNKYLMEENPEYVVALEQLPEKQREALLYGSWDCLEGAFFYDFEEDVHVIEPFAIPKNWRIFRARDYGLDRLACIWVAMDEEGFCYVYKAVGESKLIVSQSAERINEYTSPNEEIYLDICPPDLWNKNPQTGRSAEEVLREHGQYPIKANNDRINGWIQVHEFLKLIPNKEGKLVPRLRIFRLPETKELIDCMKNIQYDEKNPSDASKFPHSVTHFPDALRYFCSSYTFKPESEKYGKVEQFSFYKFAMGEYDEKDEDYDYYD
ncbi:MAG: phage terminase large subunit [Candidatus Coprovivens sp.]